MIMVGLYVASVGYIRIYYVFGPGGCWDNGTIVLNLPSKVDTHLNEILPRNNIIA